MIIYVICCDFSVISGLLSVVSSIYHLICCNNGCYWILWQFANQFWYPRAGIFFVRITSTFNMLQSFLRYVYCLSSSASIVWRVKLILQFYMSFYLTGRIGALICSTNCFFVGEFLDKFYWNREGNGFSWESSWGTEISSSYMYAYHPITYMLFYWQYMDVPQEELSGHQPLSTDWPVHGLIEFQNVTMRYKPSLPAALHDVTFTIEGGTQVRTHKAWNSLLHSLHSFIWFCVWNWWSQRLVLLIVHLYSIRLELLEEQVLENLVSWMPFSASSQYVVGGF